MDCVRCVAMLLACGLAFLLLRSRDVPAPREVGTGSVAVQPPSLVPAYNGVAIQVQVAQGAAKCYGRMVREIAELGANTVLFSIDGYQEHAGSTEVETEPAKTPPDEVWAELFGAARRERLRIILMPKVLLAKPRGREWRGVIDPGPRWEEWFGSYRRFILHYAHLAAASHVDVFVVGSELLSAEKHTQRWRDLIAAVRDVYPGLLTYSANWDHYESIHFWDDLDLVAMTSYHQTSASPQPQLSELVASWRSQQLKVLTWLDAVGKPLLFTEVGWCSQEGCSIEPWNYYRQPEATLTGLAEQKLNYQAFVEVWEECPSVQGMIWWEWSAQAGGPEDPGYTPKGKPAEAVLRDFFARFSSRQ